MVLVLRSKGNTEDSAWTPEVYLLLSRRSLICHHHDEDGGDDDDVSSALN